MINKFVQVVPDDKSVGKKLADDAMYKLEHESKDKGKSSDTAPRLVGISDIQVIFNPRYPCTIGSFGIKYPGSRSSEY